MSNPDHSGHTVDGSSPCLPSLLLAAALQHRNCCGIDFWCIDRCGINRCSIDRCSIDHCCIDHCGMNCCGINFWCIDR